jgi:hypothetical protein
MSLREECWGHYLFEWRLEFIFFGFFGDQDDLGFLERGLFLVVFGPTPCLGFLASQLERLHISLLA